MRRLGYLALLGIAGMASSAVVAAPPTLDKPGKKIRYLSLAEARAIALEHVKLGQSSVVFPGIGLDNARTAPESEDSLRVRVVSEPGSKDLIVTGIPSGPRRAEVERDINQLLLNTETAYWNVYGAYYQLYSREQAMRFAYETWKITGAQYRVGRVSRAALAQAEGQYNLFRSQRIAALDTVLDNERQLRVMLGMKIKDGTRLVPSDAPTLVEKKPNWEAGKRAAMKNRPELQMARQEVELASLDTAVEREAADYLPNRDEVRKAKLQVARAHLVLQDQELKTERYLGLWYRRISSAYFQIKAAQAQREAFGTQLRIRYELYRAGANEPGSGNPVTLNLLMEAQRFWAEALATEYQNICTYNNAICGWAFAKGEIMKRAHVRIAEETPENSAEMPAVEREHKRTLRHVRRERNLSAKSPLSVLQACGNDAKTAPSLPALWKDCPPLKEVADVQTGLIKGQGVH